MTTAIIIQFLISCRILHSSAKRVATTFEAQEEEGFQLRVPGKLPEGLPPTVSGSSPKPDVSTQLRSLHYGGDILIPVLTEVMETYPVTLSLLIDWTGPRQIWDVNAVTDMTKDKTERTVHIPVISVDWRKEPAPDRNGRGIIGLLHNINQELVLQIRELEREPESNPHWLRPDRCTKSKPAPKRVFCLQPPTATRSDPCVYTILESRFGENYFIYKGTQSGQEMVLQSVCRAYKQTTDSCSFYAGACPGMFNEETNPLGYRDTSLGAGVTYYQEASDVWMSDDFDVSLLLSLSSIYAERGDVQPRPFSTQTEDPIYIEARDKAIAQATPTYIADDISVHAFFHRLTNPSLQLGDVGGPLIPKMVMPDFGALLEYTVHESYHGHQDWFVGQEGVGKPVTFAQLDWDRVPRPKKMVVKSHSGEPIFWIKQSGEPKGSPKWRIPETCHLKSRPKARYNQLFCIVPPDSDENSPCLFTFQKSKYGQNMFVFRGQDMLYQMFCVGAGYNFCYFSEQSCPGYKYDWAQRAQLEMPHSNQIKLKVFPGQDTGLFLAISSMILHKLV